MTSSQLKSYGFKTPETSCETPVHPPRPIRVRQRNILYMHLATSSPAKARSQVSSISPPPCLLPVYYGGYYVCPLCWALVILPANSNTAVNAYRGTPTLSVGPLPEVYQPRFLTFAMDVLFVVAQRLARASWLGQRYNNSTGESKRSESST